VEALGPGDKEAVAFVSAERVATIGGAVDCGLLDSKLEIEEG
jgi:hypothetical protein